MKRIRCTRERFISRLAFSIAALFLSTFHLKDININQNDSSEGRGRSPLFSSSRHSTVMVNGFLPPSTHAKSYRYDSVCSHHHSMIKILTTRRSQRPKQRIRGDRCGVSPRLLVHANTDANNDTMDEQHVMETLWSYVNNLQRARKTKGRTKEVYSLANYLESNTFDNDTIGNNPIAVEFFNKDEVENPSNEASNRALSLVQVLERALIPAFRQAGESNDYRVILRLISGAIAFANSHPILTPRVFGEALNALSQTQANPAKLKSVWNTMIGNWSESASLPSFLESPPSAFELNIFLKSMGARGKSKACIEIYEKHCRTQSHDIASFYIQPDAYTINILISILTDSISQGQKMSDPVKFLATRKPGSKMEQQQGLRTASESLQSRLESLTYSTCWQWNTAVQLLFNLSDEGKTRQSTVWRNKYVYSSLLKLQDRAQELCSGKLHSSGFHKNGPELTMSILDDMIQNDVLPDAVTCTLAIKAMGRAVVYKNDALGDDNGNNLAVNFLERMKSSPKLPEPNQYSYSAAIKACARLKDHRTALRLLEEMRVDHCSTNASNNSEYGTGGLNGKVPPPNTWVYNAALLSLDNKKKNYSRQATKRWRNKETEKVWNQRNKEMSQQERTEVALRLLHQMDEDHQLHGLSTRPDTVTYNTLLGVGTFPHQMEESSMNGANKTTRSASSLIVEMKKENIDRDSTTYSNAIDSTVHHDDLMDILRLCLSDASFIDRKSREKDTNAMTSVFNAGLCTLTARQDFNKFMEVLALMFEYSVPPDEETLNLLISAIGKNGKTSSLVNFIQLLESKDDQRSHKNSSEYEELLESVGLRENDGLVYKLPMLSDFHYTQSINICLKENAFSDAYAILEKMRAKGINPTTTCMEGFALAYAQSAMDATVKQKKQGVPDEGKAVSVSLSRASSAYKIAMALVLPRSSTLGRVARACAMTGQWKLCRALMQSMHSNILMPKEDGTSVSISPRRLQTIRGTHSYILRECAKQGSVHAALHYTNDIQEFSKKVRAKSKPDIQNLTGKPKFSEVLTDEDDIFRNLRITTNSHTSKTNVGMQPNDWVSVIQAAAKSGHWRVCFNTLQFLRPYVERTKGDTDNRKPSDERYNQLTYALYVVIRSLESHSQDAWAVRAIEDWIDWSGRQPRVESVLSVIRVLAKGGRVEEIRHLIDTCLRKDLSSSVTKNSNLSYEEMLFVGAVTSLHNNGQYDDADEFFMSGIQDKFLPFNFFRENGQFVLDLHGLNVALAHSVVRIALRQQIATLAEEGTSSQSDLMIITGKGRNSEFHLRPILRPEVQRMLLEEFYPPLNTMSVPGNMGALTILAQDIEAWQEQQQQQKGIRMLKLASVLRNLSSQERLKKIISMKLDPESNGSD